jgi:gliding motility-associated-like protein
MAIVLFVIMLKPLYRQLSILLFFVLMTTSSYAQADTSFWFAAPDLERAHADGNIFLRLRMGSQPAVVTISQPANPGFAPITLTLLANSNNSVNLSGFLAQLENDLPNTVLNKGLLIQSNTKISCYYDIANTANGDMFALKGANALGTKFTVPFNMKLNNWSNRRNSQGAPVFYHNDIIIVATENNTEVTITPDKTLLGIAFGTTQRITLQRGQTYVCRGISENGNTKPGGTIITSTKPIAVTIKDDSIELPGLSCGDTAGDQLIPDRLAGTEFILLKGYLYNPGNNPLQPPAPGNERADHYFVFATENGTTVTTSDGNSATLNAGEHFAGTLSVETNYVTASKPIHIFHVTGFGCELSGAVIPSLKCTGSTEVSVIRATQVDPLRNEQFYLNILSPADIVNDFSLNGSNTPINGTLFLPVPGSQGKWKYAKLLLPLSVTGAEATVKNGSGKFHVGVIQGGPLSTARYGYFSDFSTNTVLIRDPLNPSQPLGDELVVCYQSNFSLEAVNTEKDLTFLWTGPGGFSSTADKLNLTNFQPGDTGKYQITTTSAGCNSSGNKTIQLKIDKPTAAFTINSNGCVEDSLTFQSPANSAARWVWVFGNGKTLDTTAGTTKPVKFNQTGETLVKLKVFSPRNCPSDDSIQTITLSTRPKAAFTVPAVRCEKDELVFTDASTITSGTLKKWKWDLGAGTGFTERSNNDPQSVRFPNYGTKRLKLLVESTTGCLSDTFKIDNFIVNPLPIPGFINPEVCQNDKESLFRDTTKSPDGFSGFTFRWDFNAGVNPVSPAPTVIPSALTAQNPIVQFNQIGSYMVKLVVNSRGCVDSVLQPFKVYGANPIPRFNMIKPAELLCSNDSIFVENQSTIDFDNVARLIIKWNATDSIIDENPAIGKIYGYRYADFLSPLQIQQTIALRAFSGTDLSCSKVTDSAIILHANPELSFDSLPSMCLLDTPKVINTTRANPAVPGNFIYSGKGVSPDGLFKPILSGPGTFPITSILVSSTSACADSATRQITVWPMPVADAGPDLRINDDARQYIQATAAGQNIKIDWSPATFLNKTDTIRPLVSNPQENTEYTLTVTGQGGCISKDAMLVTAINRMMPPNTFTPNGDGINDYWVIKNAEQYPESVVEVYTAGGQKIFRSIGYVQPWDGTFRGNPLPAGTYYFTIEPRNGRKRFAGYITLLR